MRRSPGDERHRQGRVAISTDLQPQHARRAWRLFEPYHAVIYFTPEARDIYQRVGLKGGWMGYFASRSAAMGPVSAEMVMATFYNFHPKMVMRAIPDAWSFSTPEKVLEARLQVADFGLRKAMGDLIDSSLIAEAAELAWRAVESADISGRALFAGHLAMDRPVEPHLSLWHAATCLREQRGDGHVATLVAEGVGGLEAHVLIDAAGVIPGELQRQFRGWSVQEWDRAAEGLRSRGLLDDEGLTNEGTALRTRIENRTDELALQPWVDAGDEVFEGFVRTMEPITAAIRDSKTLPYPNPIGLTRSA